MKHREAFESMLFNLVTASLCEGSLLFSARMDITQKMLDAYDACLEWYEMTGRTTHHGA